MVSEAHHADDKGVYDYRMYQNLFYFAKVEKLFKIRIEKML